MTRVTQHRHGRVRRRRRDLVTEIDSRILLLQLLMSLAESFLHVVDRLRERERPVGAVACHHHYVALFDGAVHRGAAWW